MWALPGGSWLHLLDAVTAQRDISAGHGDIVGGTQPSSRSQLLMLFNCVPLSVHFSPHGDMGMSQQHPKDPDLGSAHPLMGTWWTWCPRWRMLHPSQGGSRGLGVTLSLLQELAVARIGLEEASPSLWGIIPSLCPSIPVLSPPMELVADAPGKTWWEQWNKHSSPLSLIHI